MKADFEYRVVTNGEHFRVQWRRRGGWFFGLWEWPWCFLESKAINCGFAGVDYEVEDCATREDAEQLIAAAQEDNARHNREWVPVTKEWQVF